MNQYIKTNYRAYLSLLKQLVAIDTVFDNRTGIAEALQFCKTHFIKYLSNYDIYFDKENNLICCSKAVNIKQNILYLSAHIDTVPADKKDWDIKYDPFTPFEDMNEIVGRGVNDCKAGVAYQLFLATMLADNFPNTTNIIFTITSQEENGGDSAKEIALQIGNRLPIAKKTYLITLENNVTVNPPILAINYGERGSVAIEIEATLGVIRNFLIRDKNLWNPTIIKPFKNDNSNKPVWLHQAGGHAATTPRASNMLYKLLLKKNSENFALEGGTKRLISAVPTQIIQTQINHPIKHKVTFDLRTFKKIEYLVKELATYKINYRFVKKFDFGYEIKEKLFHDEIYQLILGIKDTDITPRFEINPGTTDTGTMYNSIGQKFKDSFIPITMGPGCRSQRDKVLARLTHGINETYDKQTGLQAIIFISEVIHAMKFLQKNS